MKKSLLLSVLFALCSPGASQLWAATDSSDRFLEAYFLIQEGDAAERRGDWAKADTKFNSGLEILHEIKTESPDWNPHIVEFRTKYIEDHLAKLKPKLESVPPPVQPAPPAEAPPEAPPEKTPAQPLATPPAETPPAPAAPPPAPPPAVENEQTRQLAAELQRAREQVRELETARDELNAKLQEQLSRVEPKQTTPQIEELLKTNQELATKLAAAQTEIAQVRERAAAAAPETAATPGESDIIQNLRAQLAESRGELQRTKEELQTARLELGTAKQAIEKAQADNVELRRSYEDIVAQLTDANRKLIASRAASDKDDEIIRQLRKENALLRVIAERKSFTAPAESEESDGSRTIPELRGWRPRSRSETTTKPLPPPPAEQSSREKLVATLTAPKKPATNEPSPEASTPAPVVPKPVTPKPAPPPPKPVPAKPVPPKPAPPVKPTPPKPATVKPAPPKPAPAAKAALPPAPPKEPAKPAEPPPAEKEQPPASPDVRSLLNEARAALALKDLNAAAAKYDTVLGLEPDNLAALSNLGTIRYQQGRLDEAEQNLRKVIAVTPNDSNARSLLGVIYFRKGLIEEAFSELNRATVIDPRNAEAHNYLGIVLSEKGWGAAGEQQIRRAIELNPQYADAHFNLAVIYAKQHTPKVELARYHYKKALELGAPTDAELETLLKKLSAKAAEPETEATP